MPAKNNQNCIVSRAKVKVDREFNGGLIRNYLDNLNCQLT